MAWSISNYKTRFSSLIGSKRSSQNSKTTNPSSNGKSFSKSNHFWYNRLEDSLNKSEQFRTMANSKPSKNELITLPLRIFAILLYCIPKFARQHPKWTYHHAVGTSIFSIWWHYTTTVEFHTTKTLKPGSEKDGFVIIDPPSITTTTTSPALYCGIIDSNPAIRPIPIGAVWFTSPPPLGETPKIVVIHFHGGAYVLGGARQMESGWRPEVLSKRIGYVLQVQYRLAIEPNSCFPAAIQDGLTAYNYVVNTLGLKPENNVLSGESAGGNLVLAMLRYLSTDGKNALPFPRAGLCWTPWLDMTTDTKSLINPQVSKRIMFLAHL
ncbi:cae8f845-da4f-4bbd-acbc-62b3a0bd3cf4 [Sclerotinia trifoliorum]|uniref:Cae8f845-da4f-4bbd-acbc-62b3a0bd3cf4 n=1 Tax=Sclerotinia trifoliorum TaxID=28548 RepID=A0A8H2VMD5_9HELO|nr:cae8f845-da4f-4bbd-acbc-62b3a0bd3cf4 [Sclerotinia trifoliorum]